MQGQGSGLFFGRAFIPPPKKDALETPAAPVAFLTFRFQSSLVLLLPDAPAMLPSPPTTFTPSTALSPPSAPRSGTHSRTCAPRASGIAFCRCRWSFFASPFRSTHLLQHTGFVVSPNGLYAVVLSRKGNRGRCLRTFSRLCCRVSARCARVLLYV